LCILIVFGGKSLYLDKLKELYRFRRLLGAMVRKDLALKYKGSALGYLWSLLLPLALTGVYTLIFGYVLGSRGKNFSIDHYPIFLMSGIFPWTFFSVSLMATSQSLVMYGGMLQKVYFPRSIIVISIVLAQMVHFMLALVPLFIFMVVFGMSFTPLVLLLPVAMILQAVFVIGLCLLVASAYVFFRDIPLILEVGMTAWFFLTPVIYPIQWIRQGRPEIYNYLRFNPMNGFIELYHQWLFRPQWFESFQIVLGPFLIALGAFLLGWFVFHRLEPHFMKRL
jgi:ABC-type polysaccharide/polyol phosphate export permease